LMSGPLDDPDDENVSRVFLKAAESLRAGID
jgi:hypothetical protein